MYIIGFTAYKYYKDQRKRAGIVTLMVIVADQ